MKSPNRTMRLQREMKSSSWRMRLKRANEVAHFDDEAQAVESVLRLERRQGAHSWRGDNIQTNWDNSNSPANSN